MSDLPAPHASLSELVADAPHLVLVLIDGLGLSTLRAHALPAGWLRSHLALELRSVFPSATASALTALASGVWPAQHALLGWWLHLQARGLDVVTLPFVVRGSGEPLEELGLSAEDLALAPSWLDRATRDVAVFQPAHIAGSAYSNYSSGGRGVGFEGLPAGVDAVLERLRGARAPSYTYLYWPEVDSRSHLHGPASPEAGQAVALVEAELERLAAGLPAGARLLVSADHGLIEVPPERRHRLRPEDPLGALLTAPPAGEPRAPLFHVRPGAEDEFAAGLCERFPARYALLRPDEAEALGLFGPGELHPEARARIGSFAAVALGPDVLEWGEGSGPLGQHGGLLAEEVEIPLLAT